MLLNSKSLTFFFNQLKRVHTFQITFQKNDKFFGVGKGSVTVKETENTLIFYENGTWKNIENEIFDFTNIYRFQLKEDKLSIEHLRWDSPIFLSDLIQIDDHSLISERARHCKQDCYMAKLSLKEDSIHLIWDIKGPTKNDRVSYTYYSEL